MKELAGALSVEMDPETRVGRKVCITFYLNLKQKDNLKFEWPKVDVDHEDDDDVDGGVVVGDGEGDGLPSGPPAAGTA